MAVLQAAAGVARFSRPKGDHDVVFGVRVDPADVHAARARTFRERVLVIQLEDGVGAGEVHLRLVVPKGAKRQVVRRGEAPGAELAQRQTERPLVAFAHVVGCM
ncbi:MAG TPA: hypothetical protein VM487_18245 [Phycisphaerae bacterium]|nr:hypothetical protein [Phycisphaerae bacterium]